MKKLHIISLFFVFCLLSAAAILPIETSAVEKCAFSRDLELGMDGEDIKCLQKYLNASGFVISSSGVGSPGHETTQLRDKTKSAIAKWQAANGLSASGFFGPLSRQTYLEVITPAATVSSSSSTSAGDALKAQLAAAVEQLNKLKGTETSSNNSVAVGSEEDAKKAILNALEEIENAEDQVDDAESGANIEDAKDGVEDAKDDLFDAVDYYFKGNFAKSIVSAEKSSDNAEDAFEDAGGTSREEKVKDFLKSLEDDIDDAWNTLEKADDDGKNTDKAENLLDEAEKMLDSAFDKYDDEKYDEAESLGEEVEDKIDDAVDSVGDVSKTDAKSAITNAENDIEDAEDSISEAEDDGDDVDRAEDLLDDANNLLKKAQDQYDDGNYDKAKDYAEDAQDRVDDALDEI